MTESKILALKYDHKNLKILQVRVMVKTILNAIKFDGPNAYLLTGMRGVGKTTTARLIAKALNCLKNNSQIKDCIKNHVHLVRKLMTLDISMF